MMFEPTTADIDWLRAAVQAEAELDFDIQIDGISQTQIASVEQGRLDCIRLYSLLFGELKRLLDQVNFGSGTEAAFGRGRQLIFGRMQSLSLEQETALNQVLADSVKLSPDQVQAQLRQQLYLLLNKADWQLITTTALAVVESKLLEQVACVTSPQPTDPACPKQLMIEILRTPTFETALRTYGTWISRSIELGFPSESVALESSGQQWSLSIVASLYEDFSATLPF
jgi:hypothetical protein